MNAYHELIHDIAFAAYQSRQHAEAETLLKLLSRPDIDFHLLQSDVRLTDWAQLATLATVRDHSSSLADFMDTAAIASEMDLVIAVDTSLAHLAGALAVPVWLMLPWAADWRWMLERSDNPWYPTMRIFRQQKHGDWRSVLAEIACELDRWPL
jgi:ADP-heptose:LPS heptosyltransferase